MLGLGANISGGSPVGIVGAAAPAPPSDYVYESDFTTDIFVNTSITSSVVDHEGRSDVNRYFNNVNESFFSKNFAVSLGPGSYEIDFWYYVPSGSNFQKLSVYKNIGSTEILLASEVQYDQWVRFTHNFNIDQAIYLFFIGRASTLSSGDCIFLSDIKISLNIAIFPSPPPGGYYDGALDQSSFSYVGAAVAYSLRLVYSYYDGPAIRVRRASDNTEQDIGFSNGVLDTSTLSTFCSGTDGFVRTWYDQSGNGNDATQTTTSAQPKVYDSVTGVVLAGLTPALLGSTLCVMSLASSIIVAGDYAVFTAHTYSSNDMLFGGAYPTIGIWYNGGLYQRFDNNTNALLTASYANGDKILSYQNRATGTWSIGANGGAASTGTNTASWTIDRLFAGYGSTAYSFAGKFQEIIIYPSDQSTNRTGIEANINDFYQMYWSGAESRLLDSHPNAAAAFSLRALNSNYTGPLVRVRSASDNAERDIFATYDGELNVNALATFCAGADGFVKVWYDQSLNGNDLVQAATASQPKIYDSVTGVVLNSAGTWPTMETTSTLKGFILPNLDLTEAHGFVVFEKYSISTAANGMFLQSASSNEHWGYSAGQILAGFYSNDRPAVAPSGTVVVNTPLLMSMQSTANQVYHINGSQTYNSAHVFVNQTTPRTYSNATFDGNYPELIIYPTDQSANRAGIEANINAFYSIY